MADERAGTADVDAKEFYAYLKEAEATDLKEVERSGCVSTGRDTEGNPVIVLVPVLGINPTEKIEFAYKNMLLLFIKKANDMVDSRYTVVYAHTDVDIISQYPLIYKFYSVLPRAYKKNLSKMYVVHPNMGLKMFFEFARVFLSHKFYSKLTLLNSILDLQRIIPPTLLPLPHKFLRKEDELRGVEFQGKLASLKAAFDQSIGTTPLIDTCATYMRAHSGLQQKGIFRVAADATQLAMAKVRLQYAHRRGSVSDSRVALTEGDAEMLIGDVAGMHVLPAQSSERKPSGKIDSVSEAISAEVAAAAAGQLEETPMSVLLVKDVHTVAHVLSAGVGYLPEALVPGDVYAALIECTKEHERAVGPAAQWEDALAEALARLPFEHLSTLVHLIRFLREVAVHAAVNRMDSSNLAIVFAPTVFHADMVDLMSAVEEMRLSKAVLKALIDHEGVLHRAMCLHGEKAVEAGECPREFIFQR